MKNGLKTRIIPILLLKGGAVVRSRGFNFHQIAGDPFNQVDRFNSWNVDELIYLDISRTGNISIEDSSTVIGSTSSRKAVFEDRPKNIYEFIEYLSNHCFMPLAFGGGIKNLDQIQKILSSGADKVVINTSAFQNPDLISDCALKFGSQSVVVSIDCKKTAIGYEVFTEGGKKPSGVLAIPWAKEVEQRGAGEVLINSIDRDGYGNGYDVKLNKPIVEALNIPVVICGGVGRVEHFSEGYENIKPHALAAANIFHFIEHSDRVIRTHLYQSGVNVRTY
jgi:imidazole glycerol-phosphate synthase subunit HisF